MGEIGVWNADPRSVTNLSRDLAIAHPAHPPVATAPAGATNKNNQNNKNETKDTIVSIDSPMVGIIYLTPKPSSPPFASKGQKIKKGDTICLIEAMKTFNEIKSDRDCTIKSVIVKNGEAVEFGQPLFEIL